VLKPPTVGPAGGRTVRDRERRRSRPAAQPEAERAATGLLGRRDELHGLLDAYQAKAARLGAAEDMDLTARYQQARDLLWIAPCDLTAAVGCPPIPAHDPATAVLADP
jgi:hypothetical protein